MAAKISGEYIGFTWQYRYKIAIDWVAIGQRYRDVGHVLVLSDKDRVTAGKSIIRKIDIEIMGWRVLIGKDPASRNVGGTGMCELIFTHQEVAATDLITKRQSEI